MGGRCSRCRGDRGVWDKREHRATCHSYMGDKQPYGFGMDAVEALKQAYENHQYLLMEEEKEESGRI